MVSVALQYFQPRTTFQPLCSICRRVSSLSGPSESPSSVPSLSRSLPVGVYIFVNAAPMPVQCWFVLRFTFLDFPTYTRPSCSSMTYTCHWHLDAFGGWGLHCRSGFPGFRSSMSLVLCLLGVFDVGVPFGIFWAVDRVGDLLIGRGDFTHFTCDCLTRMSDSMLSGMCIPPPFTTTIPLGFLLDVFVIIVSRHSSDPISNTCYWS